MARWEIDLSPGTQIVPANGVAGRFARPGLKELLLMKGALSMTHDV